MAKAEGTYVEKDKKEQQKRNKAERGALLLTWTASDTQGWVLPFSRVQPVVLTEDLPGLYRSAHGARQEQGRGRHASRGSGHGALHASRDCSNAACMRVRCI